MENTKHLHLYERIRARPNYYKCNHPDCTHYLHKMYLPHKRAICYVCLEPFIITSNSLRFAKLRCEGCRQNKPKEMTTDPDLTKMLEGMDIE